MATKIIASVRGLYAMLVKMDFEEIDPNQELEVVISKGKLSIYQYEIECETQKVAEVRIEAHKLHTFLKILRVTEDQPITVNFSDYRISIDSILI